MNLADELKVTIRRDVINKGCGINNNANTFGYDLVEFVLTELDEESMRLGSARWGDTSSRSASRTTRDRPETQLRASPERRRELSSATEGEHGETTYERRTPLRNDKRGVIEKLVR